MEWMICIILLALMVELFLISFFIIKPYLEGKNQNEKLRVENEKINLFMQMDPKLALEEIVKFIDVYIDEYVLHKFIIYKVDYIRKEDIEKMIKDLDAKILVEIPELYIFYIKTVYNVVSEEDLIRFLHKNISERVLKFTSEFNKPK